MSAVVMGDPEYFAVRHGSNPHTRTFWGMRKRVDRELAKRQWRAFAEKLRLYGVEPHIIPPVKDCPGLVYPANAGILIGKTFYPSNLLPARAAERPHYEIFFNRLGYSSSLFGGGTLRFEGEADFFPWGERMIFTYGKIEQQRTVFSRKFPFYRREYGFRSEFAAREELRRLAQGRQIVDLELCNERYYHGDTCLCSFGVAREFLLAYLPALTGPSRVNLTTRAGDHLIPLSDSDAACYAANSYAVTIAGKPHLFMPVSASADLKRKIAAFGVKVVEVDVSEFLKKGGGSVKCMVFDLSGIRSNVI